MRHRPVFIRHRVNRIEDIEGLNAGEGAEVDIRSDPCRKGSIILSHDPWTEGTDLAIWLKAYAKLPHKGPLILDTKEDGLEAQVERMVVSAGITEYFFLDTAMPTLIRRCVQQGIKQHAIRFSCYEPTVERFIGLASWVWVDCFFGEAMPPELVTAIARHFKICLASPELYGYPLDDSFAKLWPLADAICTDDPGIWLSLFG